MVTSAAAQSLPADSKMGFELLSKARRVNDAQEVDNTWVAGYDIKFQGCLHVAQWGADEENGGGEDDVMVATKRLVRFRLCPSGFCSSESGYGCNSDYGDYVIDMDTYVANFLEHKNEYQEQKCEQFIENGGCSCENNGDDQYDEQSCFNSCFAAAGMDYCKEDEDGFQVDEYLECGQYQPPENQYYNNNNRKLEEQEAQYFIGPYCAEQGGQIHLGMFTEETCTNFADSMGGRTTFESISYGATLPYEAYSGDSLVDSNCWSCKQENEDEYYNAYAEAEVNEMCENIYQFTGKCEENLSISYPNENACNYLEGIKMTRKTGIIYSGSSSKNKVASAFIGIFAVSFILLGAYVYYLKSKLDRGRINLSD